MIKIFLLNHKIDFILLSKLNLKNRKKSKIYIYFNINFIYPNFLITFIKREKQQKNIII